MLLQELVDQPGWSTTSSVVLRIAGTGMLAELYGQDAATGLPHVVWGKVVYVAMLVPLVMLVLRLRRSGS